VLSTPEHWNDAYAAGDRAGGWFQAQATMSMSLLAECGVAPDAAIVDVGSGASVFLDNCQAVGFVDLTALDLSAAALAHSQRRLGSAASGVDWQVADVRTWQPHRTYEVWHDRAVLHFLLTEQDRQAYRSSLIQATHQGSWIILGVFSQTGPTSCAGLPVHRSSPAEISAFLSPDFVVKRSVTEGHVRPDGGVQDYVWTLAQRG